jgi:mannose-1-phosphate guanylyltransferase/mannose-1-phosphate guanylyltransferase/mannose-6-phosphate isomerase
MLQMTAARTADQSRFAPPILVAGASQADMAAAQLAEIGIPAGHVVVEPSARNTAAAIALAALAADQDALLLVMPSDHLIADPASLIAAVEAAAPLARAGWLTTFGIKPDRPETGFGYIRRGEVLAAGVYKAEAFVEKPDEATARAYLAEGRYDWNGGIFLFTAAAYLAALARHAPDIASAVGDASDKGDRNGIHVHPDADLFAAVRSQSIDHAVMEHADKIAVVPVDMGWSDVGSWQALHDASQRDIAENALTGDVLTIDSKGCLIRSDGPTIVAIGVQDLAIIAAGNAILVVAKEKSQDVQEAVKLLAQNGRTDLL